MIHRTLRAAGTGLLALSTLFLAAAAAPETPMDRGIGQAVGNFTLPDTSGNPLTLHAFRHGRAVVLVFLGTDCPVGNLYTPRLVELSHQYKDRGVVFLAINANAHETADQVAAHAREHKIDFPVLKDTGNRVADQLQIERMCEVLLIDANGVLRYRGAVDDQYGYGTRRDTALTSYLRDALDAVLAGRPVAVAATPVVGCLLDRADAPPPARPVNSRRVRPAAAELIAAFDAIEAKEPVEVGRVTYAGDVAAILQNRCQSCHRPGEVAPFSLLSYDDARGHAAMIAEVVDDRRMPPWHADPRYGHFRNDRHLTPRERATLLAWVEQGTPLGDPAALPPPRTFPQGWQIGTPDIIFELPEPQTVAAQGTIPYIYVRVPTHFKDDVWVQAAEARPGNPAVVHHIVVIIDDHSGAKRGMGEGHLCGTAPGDMPTILAPGTAKLIPAGSDLIFQMHYTPVGTVHTDRSRVGLIYARGPVEHRVHTRAIGQRNFVIPPGASDYTVSSTFTFPRDAHLYSFMPHMHLRGKNFKYTATYPDGSSEVLLSVPAYDFGWQSVYMLTEPRAMPRGTRIDCLGTFDNSAANPSNPDPTKAVAFGEQTWEEMMIGWIDYIDDAPASSARPAAADGESED
jgi:peroxiredoxin